MQRKIVLIAIVAVVVCFVGFVRPVGAACTGDPTCSCPGPTGCSACSSTQCFQSCCGPDCNSSGGGACSTADDCAKGNCGAVRECVDGSCIVWTWGEEYWGCCSGGGGGDDDDDDDGCTCDCDCSDLDVPASPALLAPEDGGSRIAPVGTVLDWEDIANWGQDIKNCEEDVDDCACIPAQSPIDTNRRYELYLSTTPPTDVLPPANRACDVRDGRFACAVLDSGYTVDSSSKYFPLLPGTTYYWAVRAVNPGPDCVVRSAWVARSFTTNYAPTVENIEVLDSASMHCRLADGTMSRWTGNMDDNPTGVNNPIRVAMTLKDRDGWDDIASAVLVMAPARDSYLLPSNCTAEFEQFVSLHLWRRENMTGEWWRSAVAMEVAESACTPNCHETSQASCDAISGCSWSEEAANFWQPYGCKGCTRDWSELAFNPDNPRYAYDPPCRFPDGELASCHGCYFQTVHPGYEITDISHQVSVDGLSVTFIFTLDVNTALPEGRYQMYGMARNWYPNGNHVWSGGANPACTDYDACKTTQPGWTWGFDFSEPNQISVDTAHLEGDEPDTMRFEEIAADSAPNDSGLMRIFGRRYWIDREGAGRIPPGADGYFDIGSDVQLAGNSTWSIPFVSAVPHSGFEGGDVVHSELSAIDRACNIRSGNFETGPIGREWVQTTSGDAYGWDGLFDPIPKVNESLSDYWLGGGENGACSEGNFFNGLGSARGWCSGLTEGYQDRNSVASRHVGWYAELERRAAMSDFVRASPSGNIEDIAEPINWSVSGDHVYRYTGSDDSALVLTGACVDRKVVFVPEGKQVVVQPDVTLPDPDDTSACIIIGQEASSIVVDRGGNSPTCVDRVAAAFITDGTFTVVQDDIAHVCTGSMVTSYDRLVINGFVFAHKSDLLRDLIFVDNLEAPAETVTYDPRYMALFRDIFGGRQYSDFECGIVSGSSACSGWFGE